MAKPYYLHKRGKVWTYRLRTEKTFHSTGKTVKSDAEDIASEQFRLRGLSASAGVPLGVYQRPYYTDDCPHCSR